MERKKFSSKRDILREMPLFHKLSNRHLGGVGEKDLFGEIDRYQREAK